MASALAYFGALLGFPVCVVCSSKLTNEKAQLIKYFGAQLIQHGDFTIEGNAYCQNSVGPRSGAVRIPGSIAKLEKPRGAFRDHGP